MELIDLIRSRHSVRKYQDKPIEKEKRDTFNNYIENKLCRAKGTPRIVACFDEPKAFENPDVHYGWFVNAKNYFVLIGKKYNELDEITLGFEGEKLVLKAQEMGLNTCWVALTFEREIVPVKLNEDEQIYSVISVGYGFKNGRERPSKTAQDVIACDTTNKPEWFDLAVEACLLAPTAKNLQRFKIVNDCGRYQVAESQQGEYSKIDLGIVKCHFELIEGRTTL